jgi:hypothetical protein
MKKITRIISLLLCICIITPNVFAHSACESHVHDPADGRELPILSIAVTKDESLVDLFSTYDSIVTGETLSADVAKHYSNSIVVHVSDLRSSEDFNDFLEKNTHHTIKGLEIHDTDLAFDDAIDVLVNSKLDAHLILWVDNEGELNMAAAQTCIVCGNSQMIDIGITIIGYHNVTAGVVLLVLVRVVCYFNHNNDYTYEEHLNAPYCYGCNRYASWQGNYNWKCNGCGNWF